MSTQLTFFFAFVVVLALIGAAAWLVRRFAGSRLGTNANRGRMPRLAVIDAAAVDGRRRLVLVRRDNIEHLLMIGGPTDIVVEPNIVRAQPAREQVATRAAVPAREPAPMRPAQRSEPLVPRPAPRPSEPPPLKAAPPVRTPERAPAPATADQNLAEMAQRLEAALRRPAGDAKADGTDRAPPVAPD